MANKRHKLEEIVQKLRQVDVLVGQAMQRVDAIHKAVSGYFQTKRALDGAGGFVASPYNKTLSIQVHETWPGVPEPSCLSPGTGNQEPGLYRTIDHAPSTYYWRCLGLISVD